MHPLITYISIAASVFYLGCTGDTVYSEIQQKSSGAEVIQMVPRLLSMEYDDFFSQVPQDQNQWFQLHFQSEREIKNAVAAIKSI